MLDSLNHDTLAPIVQRIDPRYRLTQVETLTGGVSAQVIALQVSTPEGEAHKLLLRVQGDVDRQRNPHIAADEFKLLTYLHGAGLPVPMPLHVDESGALLPTPYLLVTYMDGAPEFSPQNLPDFIEQYTAALVAIHGVSVTTPALDFLPQMATRAADKVQQRPAALDDALSEGRLRNALDVVWPVPQINASVLLHGDYWPGNILWRDGQLMGVIDWEDAALGDPLADIANSRLEILWAFGREAMQDFTRQYQAAMPALDYAMLSYWDLYAALKPMQQLGTWAAGWPALGRADVSEATMRAAHLWFFTEAFERLKRFSC